MLCWSLERPTERQFRCKYYNGGCAECHSGARHKLGRFEYECEYAEAECEPEPQLAGLISAGGWDQCTPMTEPRTSE